MAEPMRVMPRVLVCKGEDIERAEALLGAACEGYVEPHAAHETPMKTGSANADVAHDDAEMP